MKSSFIGGTSVSDNFVYNGPKPNFARDAYDTISEMKDTNFPDVPKVFPAVCNETGKLYIYNINNTVDPTLGKWRELKGDSAPTEGKSIDYIEKTKTEGLVDTYTIHYTDGTTSTFEVTNGKDGRGIKDIKKTSSSGLVDTYTITFDDDTTTTFTVTNGKDGGGSGSSSDLLWDKNINFKNGKCCKFSGLPTGYCVVAIFGNNMTLIMRTKILQDDGTYTDNIRAFEFVENNPVTTDKTNVTWDIDSKTDLANIYVKNDLGADVVFHTRGMTLTNGGNLSVKINIEENIELPENTKKVYRDCRNQYWHTSLILGKVTYEGTDESIINFETLSIKGNFMSSVSKYSTEMTEVIMQSLVKAKCINIDNAYPLNGTGLTSDGLKFDILAAYVSKSSLWLVCADVNTHQLKECKIYDPDVSELKFNISNIRDFSHRLLVSEL